MLLQRVSKFGTIWLWLTGLSAAHAGEKVSEISKPRVQIIQLTNRFRVEINGQLFTEYFFNFEALSDKSAGNFLLPAGRTVTFRYRFYFHEGDAKQARVAEHYAEYLKSHLNPSN